MEEATCYSAHEMLQPNVQWSPHVFVFGDAVFGLNQPIGHVLLGNRFRETMPGKPCTTACHFLERGCTVADIGAGGSAERNDRLTCEIVGFDGIVHSQTGAIHQIGKPRYTVLPAPTMSWAGITRGQHVP